MSASPITDSFSKNVYFTPSSSLERESNGPNSTFIQEIFEVFKNRIGMPESISLYEVGPFPNAPGSTNLIGIPSDIYNTLCVLINAYINEDREELQDATARLTGIPANAISALGLLSESGLSSFLTISLFPFAYIAGGILCFIEGCVDSWGLRRQIQFEKKLDLKFISNFRYLLADFDPLKSSQAIRRMAKRYGDTFEIFKVMEKELIENPYDAKKILSNHADELSRISSKVLIENLQEIQDTFLTLSKDEISQIISKISKKHPSTTPEKLKTLFIRKIEKKIHIKKKNLARRIRPWMVSEASEKIPSLMTQIQGNNKKAIQEGLRLMDDMYVQSRKKQVIHILGIVALVFAAAFLIAISVAAPPLIPLLLMGGTMLFSFSRAIMYSGTLGSRGWTFEAKKPPPKFIQRLLFKPKRHPTPKLSISHL